MPIVDRLFELAIMGRMALYCDIDGTLSRIAPTPDSARIEPGSPEALRRISGFGIRVVAISGRSAEDARNLVGLHEIDYAGNHGFELLTRDGRLVSEEVRQASLLVQQALSEIEALGVRLPAGVLIENKVYTGSVHYRLTADHDQARQTLLPLLTAIAERHGLHLTSGRMVFELRPRLDINKGVFVINDVRLHGITTAAFLGDDLTDVDGFIAVHYLEEERELLSSTAIAVTSDETPAAVLTTADLTVAGVGQLVAKLTEFAKRLEGHLAP